MRNNSYQSRSEQQSNNSNITDPRTTLTQNFPAPIYLQLPIVFPRLATPIDTKITSPSENNASIPFNCPETDFSTEESNFVNESNLERNKKDNIACGDAINKKQPNTIRLYFQNIRGAKNNNSWDDWIQSANYLQQHEVDIISYTETNIKWTDANKIEARNNIKNIKPLKYYKHSIISTSNSDDPYGSYFQPGGTCTIATNNFTGRVVKDIGDTSGLGRWSGLRLKIN